MATYVIVYDAKRPVTAYHASDKLLTDAIKSISNVYWNHLDNTYLVVSALSACRIKAKLAAHLGDGGKLLVAKVDAGQGAWEGFTDKAGEWLSARA
jgi:hypothetical protein